MPIYLLSFLAGVVTVLAPCAFLLLPVIIGGSAQNQNRFRPYIITASLAISLLLFTVVLKTSTLLIDINPDFLKYFSGITIILLGLISLFPGLWDRIQVRFNLSSNSDKLLDKASENQGFLGAVLTGFALGPVFSSCSPTYVYILTVVLRQDYVNGFVNILFYILGLSSIMLGVSLAGRSFVSKLKWAVNPEGIFKRVISILFILVGIGILTGLDKQLQSSLVPYSPVSQLEENLLQNTTTKKQNSNFVSSNTTSNNPTTDSEGIFNINPPTKAPEITGISDWINSDPQTLANLKGKVVLIDFWTYSCINCIRSAPYINTWYDTYKDQGFVVLGIHAPEFAFEQKKENVEKAVKNTFNIKYPVGLDNKFATWDAYQNNSWPAKYLIDKDGNLRYTHFGEGEYDVTERAIQILLKEAGKKPESTIMSNNVQSVGQADPRQTPETYLGWSRSLNFANNSELKADTNAIYTLSKELKSDFWSLGGDWIITGENITSNGENDVLNLKFNAKEVYIVAGADTPTKIKLKINGKNINEWSPSISGVDVPSDGTVTIGENRLYKLVKSDKFLENTEITMEIPKGVTLNAFTFGG